MKKKKRKKKKLKTEALTVILTKILHNKWMSVNMTLRTEEISCLKHYNLLIKITTSKNRKETTIMRYGKKNWSTELGTHVEYEFFSHNK